MELKKVVVKALDILLHGPTTIKTVFIPHPASTFFNVKSHIFLITFGLDQVSLIQKVRFIFTGPDFCSDCGSPVIGISLGDQFCF
jgi:hypothetical protein